ncbi:CcmD family protein [Thermoflavifilum aggregans]|uniref:CcmD family protein n=1 Tax=Thermoflavifilum aggregans TaxID=454188 RepID=A0A2M9CWV9_9BACT|nr:CcmD family protein [Thermoflavifilum aggregans]MBX6380339.1 CcmD family protein [Thermoflavifilum aggregans]PJJ76416.1 CcmD family protein [Thermoflavifilum aggregans]
MNIVSHIASVASALLQVPQEGPEMATLMRSNGKIYVVVAVIVVIWLGVLLYLISIDRKLSRLEKAEAEKNRTRPTPTSVV